MHYNLFYDWLRYVLPFGLGSAVKEAEDEDDWTSLQIMAVFVDQPLALPGFVKKKV